MTVFHLGVTASRSLLVSDQLYVIDKILFRIAKKYHDCVMHFGDCVNGDEIIASMGRNVGFKLHCHPPDNDSLRAFVPSDLCEHPLPYLIRNHNIVDSSALLLGAPGQEKEVLRSGTWSTIRYARRIGRPLVLVLPSGRTLTENGEGDQSEEMIL